MSRMIKDAVIGTLSDEGEISQVGIATSADPVLPIEIPATCFTNSLK